MMRLKSRLLSLSKASTGEMKVYSPKNCEELRIPFKTDKVAKVVGKLASIPPPRRLPAPDDLHQESQELIAGVIVQNDFKMSLMDPEDLREYAGLTTSTIACRQRLMLSAAGVDLVRWALEGTFGGIEELPETKNRKSTAKNGDGDGDVAASGGESDDDGGEELGKATAAKKKKSKKKKPKKKGPKSEQQTEPPRVGLSKLFPDGNYPEGELHEYKDE